MEPSWKLPSGAQKVAETHPWEPGCYGGADASLQTPGRCRPKLQEGHPCRSGTQGHVLVSCLACVSTCQGSGLVPAAERVTGPRRVRREMAESVLGIRWGACSDLL